MYKDKKFRIRNLDEVVEDIIMAKKHYMFDIERVFLADGDALIVKTKDLLYIIDKIHEHGKEDYRIEGTRDSNWLLVDMGDVVVNVFTEDARDFYGLEKLWSNGKKLELNLD